MGDKYEARKRDTHVKENETARNLDRKSELKKSSHKPCQKTEAKGNSHITGSIKMTHRCTGEPDNNTSKAEPKQKKLNNLVNSKVKRPTLS